MSYQRIMNTDKVVLFWGYDQDDFILVFISDTMVSVAEKVVQDANKTAFLTEGIVTKEAVLQELRNKDIFFIELPINKSIQMGGYDD